MEKVNISWTAFFLFSYEMNDVCNEKVLLHVFFFSFSPTKKVCGRWLNGISFSNPSSLELNRLAINSSINYLKTWMSTYDHRSVKAGHPVRSAIHKH